MIAYIRGRLEYVEPEEGFAVLETGGIGFQIFLSGRDLLNNIQNFGHR